MHVRERKMDKLVSEDEYKSDEETNKGKNSSDSDQTPSPTEPTSEPTLICLKALQMLHILKQNKKKTRVTDTSVRCSQTAARQRQIIVRTKMKLMKMSTRE